MIELRTKRLDLLSLYKFFSEKSPDLLFSICLNNIIIGKTINARSSVHAAIKQKNDIIQTFLTDKAIIKAKNAQPSYQVKSTKQALPK